IVNDPTARPLRVLCECGGRVERAMDSRSVCAERTRRPSPSRFPHSQRGLATATKKAQLATYFLMLVEGRGFVWRGSLYHAHLHASRWTGSPDSRPPTPQQPPPPHTAATAPHPRFR